MHRREIKSYVIRKGRFTAGQKRALADHWSRFGLEVSDGLIDTAMIFPVQQPLVLEIGFGMGESLLETAYHHQNRNYIGVEVHRPGVGHLLHLAAEAELKNLRVYCADSVNVLSNCLPVECLEKVQIFFPDPWHKKKHHKRRLITANFVNLLAKALKSGGVVHIATDWDDYAEQIDTVFKDWPTCDIPERSSTKYEKRGLKLKHDVHDLAYTKIERDTSQSEGVRWIAY